LSDEAAPIARRRLRKRWIALAVLLLIAIVLASLWSQRQQIATGYIERELARRHVQAHYKITRFGIGTQRMEHVRIGDPAHPDLTADWVELRMSYGLRYPRVAWITARGVRLYGRVIKGKLSLGQIDRLLPAPKPNAPFALPNVSIDIADAAMRLDTPAGVLGLSLLGSGNLSGGFRGRAVVLSDQLDLSGCTVQAPVAVVAFSISGRKPSLQGPVRSQRLTCGTNVEAQAPLVDLDLTLAQALDAWVGRARLRSDAMRLGSDALSAIDAGLSLLGNAKLTKGRLALAGANGRFGDVFAAKLLFDGRYEASAQERTAQLDGDATATTLVVNDAVLHPFIASMRGTSGTPIEPFGQALAGAIGRAGKNVDAKLRLALAVAPGKLEVRIANLDAVSASGARLTLAGGDGLAIGNGANRINGRLALAGGGFPQLDAVLNQSQPGGPLSGTAFVRPYVVGSARLAVTPIRFEAGSNGVTHVITAAKVDGPFSGGQVRALEFPITGWFGHGAFAFGERCSPFGFQAFRYGTLSLTPTRIAICAIGPAIVWKPAGGAVRGGGEIRSLRLAGRLGSSPITYASDQLRFDVAQRGFRSDRVAIRLGNPDYVNRLDLAALTGRFTKGGVTGDFAGGAGKVGNVPLLLSQAKGKWQLIGGKARVDGAMRVADEANPSRFYPLRTDDFRLTLINNRIEANGWLKDPETETSVMRAVITHDLNSGEGRAKLDVPGITFTDRFQPEQITRLTLGVIALVKGTVKGEGEIAWDRAGTTSRGTFSTVGMNLAAPFGPVSGLTTTIHFNDLLGLTTPPSQQASVEQIQAGIDVFDGQVRYQLLPGLKVRVQGAEWPFAGGRLLLEETVLDFSQQSAKHLTFHVQGMDAAAFVEQMKFSNIAATGTFDGIVPMVFDEHGGRIVNGYLAARPAGGTVSYIGELTEAELGSYGKLAFDALKALRYSKLAITLNGDLAGEFVAGVELDGIAREATNPGGVSGYVLGQLAKIPFKFHIVARGPFRAIIGTMRSLRDPSGLIQQVMPAQLRDQPTSVQAKESETVQ
jgi:translocation and assembly module TamB